MASLRQLRGRIKSTQNSKQIMRAMQLVSASKLKRAQSRLLQAREVLAFLDGLLQRVLAATSDMRLDHPLCETRQEGPSALVLLTSDAGLCGAYNTNLIQLADAHLRRDSLRRTHVIYIGKKGYRYFVKRGYAASEAYLELAGRPNLATAQEIGRSLMDRFLSHRVVSVELLYSRFVSSSVYRPTVRQWLPIELSPQSTVHSPQLEYIFELSARRVFEELLPRWALATFQGVMLE
ncbi:MAG: F0F1 ATP synthase subunit gamma, partial [Candidatus Omnitrophica bacterium]|nr:F0F1 ATP synthase subunit gamma [Candidatus Omnitrophota bacterium]